ncbi:MAG: hypothetical protein LBF74_14835 [Treponema sp.]|jgi:hypothetical protein|nr:hypothetical protein [Treponema sp.]
MKKIIALSVLFGVLTAGVYAQITLGGEMYTGIVLDIPSDGDESIDVNHRKKGNTLFELTATVNKDNFGAKLDTSFIKQTDFFRLNGIYGWAYFLNKQIRLTLGDISDAVWVTTLDNEYHLDDVSGFRLEYKTPLPGLSVGAAFDAGGYTLEKFAKQVIFGASYVHALFNTVAAYDMGSNAQTIFGFNFTGIDQLTTAGIELKASNLALWDKLGSFVLDEEVAYQIIREFTAVLHLGQSFYGAPGSDLGLLFRPGVRYKFLPALTAFLDVEVNSEDVFKTTNLVLHPWVEYSLGNLGLLYLEYKVTLSGMKSPSHLIGFGLDIKAF